jgi:hypothetical protein
VQIRDLNRLECAVICPEPPVSDSVRDGRHYFLRTSDDVRASQGASRTRRIA